MYHELFRLITDYIDYKKYGDNELYKDELIIFEEFAKIDNSINDILKSLIDSLKKAYKESVEELSDENDSNSNNNEETSAINKDKKKNE